MKGDITRNTFNPKNHYSRVLMQQGRVQLDADWNEQGAILLHTLRSLAADLIGPHGGPAENLGFDLLVKDAQIDALMLGNQETTRLKQLLAQEKVLIGKGRYYVHGLLCVNEEHSGYSKQIDYPFPFSDQLGNKTGDFIVYLDVWERHITSIEDDDIREKALSGPDTATRAKVVWQAKVKEYRRKKQGDDFKGKYDQFSNFLNGDPPPTVARIQARAMKSPPNDDEPCLIAPESRYRGPENQLYRVEIHKSGALGQAGAPAPTFKWSRENGSVIFPIKTVEGLKVSLEHLGRDARFGLKPEEWVEIVNDDSVLQNRADHLWQIESLDTVSLQVTLKPKAGAQPLQVLEGDTRHPLLRRWESAELPIEIPTTNDGWIPLEYGVEVKFGNGAYRSGDYWLIPARTATGDVEWPGPVDPPDKVPPHGVTHHYAPLAIISVGADGTVTTAVADDLRRKLKQSWE